jgi:hypothetical protein
MLRAAGAIADYRIVRLQDQLLVQVLPGDALMDPQELRRFVSEMLGSDIKVDQLAVVEAETPSVRSH